MDGYANLIAARLRKLAATGSTGTLPLTGPGEGAIILRGGRVVRAESSRTPQRRAADLAALGLALPAAGPPLAPGRPSPAGGGASLAVAPSMGRLAAMIAHTEPTIDAATELLSGKSRYAKFRQAGALPPAHGHLIPVEALLAEVQRRHQVLRKLAAVVTADTPVTRSASAAWPRIQVSPAQWALVVGLGDGMTPRSLALELGRSVFATTIEVYRLIELGLLAVPGHVSVPAGGPGRIMAFMCAVPDERGTNG